MIVQVLWCSWVYALLGMRTRKEDRHVQTVVHECPRVTGIGCGKIFGRCPRASKCRKLPKLGGDVKSWQCKCKLGGCWDGSRCRAAERQDHLIETTPLAYGFKQVVAEGRFGDATDYVRKFLKSDEAAWDKFAEKKMRTASRYVKHALMNRIKGGSFLAHLAAGRDQEATWDLLVSAAALTLDYNYQTRAEWKMRTGPNASTKSKYLDPRVPRLAKPMSSSTIITDIVDAYPKLNYISGVTYVSDLERFGSLGGFITLNRIDRSVLVCVQGSYLGMTDTKHNTNMGEATFVEYLEKLSGTYKFEAKEDYAELMQTLQGHRGYLEVLVDLYPAVIATLEELKRDGSLDAQSRIYVTGHSLGAAVGAMLYLLLKADANVDMTVWALLYAQPHSLLPRDQVEFADLTKYDCINIINTKDPVVFISKAKDYVPIGLPIQFSFTAKWSTFARIAEAHWQYVYLMHTYVLYLTYMRELKGFDEIYIDETDGPDM